ncbi:EamA family transporter [Bdellovibrio sp. NC01]|uniref:EamA family transporter n=1 Tax=Bdellovibrio sp. NC01 TaxID=2220073 RepID=UPI00115AEB5F|nr:EamA family transporter [Bdellovibrio sp. NC01]QDK39402.1 multidrug DMT transporter permease [Bdellovibrio sp. NC01]
MNSSAVLLLTSAFLHAAWNAIAKHSRDKEAFLFLAMSVSNIVAAAMVLQSQVFLPGEPIIWAILAGVFEGTYLLTLSKALTQNNLGRAYAIMRGGAMLVVWIFSTLFFGETATLLQMTGAGVIFAGLLLLNIGSSVSTRNTDDQGVPVEKPLWQRVPWSWVCAVCIAGYHLSYHKALHHGAEPRSLFAVAMVISWPFLLLALGRKPSARVKKVWREQKKGIFAVGVFSFLSFVIFLYGLQVSAPGFAISLRNSSIFFAILFSFFLKESLTRVQIIGALTVGLGAIFLSWS